MKIFKLMVLCHFFLVTEANAFDRLHCQSSLKDWIVTLADSTKTAVLTPYNQNTSLTEFQSQRLIVKDSNAESLVTIFPWNTLYVRVPGQTKQRYEVRSTEMPGGFSLEITDKNSKVVRNLKCRFTF